MVSTHPGDHNDEKIKIGPTSQFSAIACFFVISYDEFECIIMSNILSTIFRKAPSSEINRQ